MKRDYDETLFAGTAGYYARYRFGYPEKMIHWALDAVECTSTTPVLDLGCGTGQLALPIACRGIPVVGVDPDSEMLVEASRQLSPGLPAGFLCATDANLRDEAVVALLPRPVRLVVMGASFHWMDREQVPRTLDGIVDAGGGVAVFSSGKSTWREAPWPEVVSEVIRDFLGPERRAGRSTYEHPPERHEVVLARSPFGDVRTEQFVDEKQVTIDEIIGLQLSMSFASPRLLGDRLDEFEQTLRERLQALEPGGVFSGEVEYEGILAVRP